MDGGRGGEGEIPAAEEEMEEELERGKRESSSVLLDFFHSPPRLDFHGGHDGGRR